MSSQNLRVATYIPALSVQSGDVVVAKTPANVGQVIATMFDDEVLPVNSTPVFYGVVAPNNPRVGELWLDLSTMSATTKPTLKAYTSNNIWEEVASSPSSLNGSAAVPQATKANQILVSSADKGFPWKTGQIDLGRY